MLVRSSFLPRCPQSADFGPKTALRLVDTIRDGVKSGRVKTAGDIRTALKVRAPCRHTHTYIHTHCAHTRAHFLALRLDLRPLRGAYLHAMWHTNTALRAVASGLPRVHAMACICLIRASDAYMHARAGWLQESIVELLNRRGKGTELSLRGKPSLVLIVGVNGAGKTTTVRAASAPQPCSPAGVRASYLAPPRLRGHGAIAISTLPASVVLMASTAFAASCGLLKWPAAVWGRWQRMHS